MGTFVQRNNIVHVIMVLDMSGSMAPQWNDTIGGVNSYLEGLKKDIKTDYRITIVNFDTVYEVLCSDTTLFETPKLTKENYCPRGMTALYDAVGRALTETEAKVATHTKALVVIVTDGQENSSREQTQETIRSRIKSLQDRGNWTFIFLGAVEDAWTDAKAIGIDKGNVLRYDVDKTADLYAGMTNATVSYSRDLSNTSSSIFMEAYGSDLQGATGDDDGK